MHFQTSASLLALLGGLSHVQAYWLVASAITGFGGPVGGTGNQWLVADSLDCDVLNNAGLVNSASDVSSNDGVRVVWGDGDCANWPGTGCPTVAEQHFPDFHRTWYAARGNDLVDLDDNVVGNCVVNTDTDKQCDVTAGVVRYQSLLDCTLY